NRTGEALMDGGGLIGLPQHPGADDSWMAHQGLRPSGAEGRQAPALRPGEGPRVVRPARRGLIAPIQQPLTRRDTWHTSRTAGIERSPTKRTRDAGTVSRPHATVSGCGTRFGTSLPMARREPAPSPMASSRQPRNGRPNVKPTWLGEPT